MMDNDADDDEQLARKLQEEYDREVAVQLLQQLQDEQDQQGQGEENDKDVANRHSHGEFGFGGLGQGTSGKTSHPMKTSSTNSGFLASDVSPVDPSLENSDPNPDIRVLFLQFNTQFFWGKLSGIEVKWSPRMTLCAGLCVYEGRGGLCSVRLSLPLLKLRPRKDLVETLLHEMIHAYLFVTDNDRDHDGHGPQFQGHMRRINKATGANISIYHTFHDEVASYQQHWWRCDGPCQNRRPYFGYVKRAMNRAPSSRDFWWAEHQATCGGSYTKIKEPEGYSQKKGGKKVKEQGDKTKSQDIRAFKGKGHQLGSSSSKASHSKPNTNSSSVGSSSNPATIFNSVIGSQSNRLNGGSTSTPSTSASTSTSSIIVNGILQRKAESKISSLISKMKSDNAHSAMDNNKAAISVGGNSQSNENGTLSKSQEDAVAKRRYGCQDEDDDDLWITDINNIESRPLSSFMRGKAVKKDSDSDSVRKNSDSVNSGKSKARDGWKLGVNVFKSRKSSSAYKRGSTKPSVCKGSAFYKEHYIQKRKKYVLDDLDSNDDLWDLPRPALEVKREVKAEVSVSPLKAKLKTECQIKDEERADKGLPQTDTSSIKTEKSPLLNDDSEERVDLILKSLKNNRIKKERENGEERQRDVTRGSQRYKLFNQDIVDLSDIDDEFDFVSLVKKSSQNKTSKQGTSSQSQKSISSFFASSGSKKSSNRKSIFSNVKGHVCGLDTSFCSKCKNDKGVNEELPDIIDLDDEEFQSPSPKKSSSENPTLRDLMDMKRNKNDVSGGLSSKKNIFAFNSSILPKSQKSSTHKKNIFSNASQCSSTPSGNMAKTWLGSNKYKNLTVKIDDLSDSSEDEFMDFRKAKNKKRSSRDAFSSDESDFSDDINVSNNKDTLHSSNGLSFNKQKRSGNSEDSPCSGSSSGSKQEPVDKHKTGKKRSSHDAFASNESDCLDDDDISNNKDTHRSSNGLSFKVPKRSGDGEDSSCNGSRNGSIREPADEANGSKAECPVCGVFVSTADINVHLDACLTQ